MYSEVVIITKVLDVAGIQNGIEKTLKSLKNKQKEIAAIETAVQGILALEDAFKGKSADAMRNYYREVHLPFISYYKTFIEDYESKLTIMGNELQALESAKNGRIVEVFLAEDLQSSLQNTANHTITLTDETNQTILDLGINNSIDESCLSSKIYLGHALYLSKTCDYILVSRVCDYGKKDKVCSRLNGLYDTLKCIIPDKVFIQGIGFKKNFLIGISNEKIGIDGIDCILNTQVLEGK